MSNRCICQSSPALVHERFVKKFCCLWKWIFTPAFVQFTKQFEAPYELYREYTKTFVTGTLLFYNLIKHHIFRIEQRFRSFNIKFRIHFPILSPLRALWKRLTGIVKFCISKSAVRQTIPHFNFTSDAHKTINLLLSGAHCKCNNF